jgi:hypothetical protein
MLVTHLSTSLAYWRMARGRLAFRRLGNRKSTGLSPEGSYVLIDCLARLFCQLEPDRLTRFLLPHSGTFDCISIWRNVLDFESDDITAAQLAVDCEIEHCEIAKLLVAGRLLKVHSATPMGARSGAQAAHFTLSALQPLAAGTGELFGGRLHCQRGPFMFANKGLEGIVLRIDPRQLKFAIVGRKAHTCASPTGLPWALVTERPVALPPVWLEEGSMFKTDQYRQFAHDCVVWARIAISDEQRELFLELSKKWMRDAESIDRGIELQPNEAVKASEMAAEEIDRLGDPLATEEERQFRKGRLISGPEEFRDIRNNRGKAVVIDQ